MSLPPPRRRRRLQPSRGSLASAEPPFFAVLRLDGGRHGGRHLVAIAVAVVAHGLVGAAAALQHEATDHPAPPARHPEIRATLQRAPPPPPPPPEPPRARQPEARAPRPVPRAAPPSPAQAGRVIAQAPAPSGPADLTGFDLVVGQGESYAGGYSSAQGQSRAAVADPGARVGGVPDAPPARAAEDLSRPAAPLRRDWACAWPDEAQDSDLRDARATLRVSVSADGTPAQVEVLAAPPGGFGEAARRCAEHELFRAALDSAGRPIAAPTHLFNVHFLR